MRACGLLIYLLTVLLIIFDVEFPPSLTEEKFLAKLKVHESVMIHITDWAVSGLLIFTLVLSYHAMYVCVCLVSLVC